MILLLPLLLDFGHQGSFESIYWSFLLSRSGVIRELTLSEALLKSIIKQSVCLPLYSHLGTQRVEYHRTVPILSEIHVGWVKE